MRGKATPTCARRLNARITPAHAGKSAAYHTVVSHGQDHPRPCGEKSNLKFASVSGIGSPPPMRGKGREILDSVVTKRITPAHAGKSYLPAFKQPFKKDHPRPCGEKGDYCTLGGCYIGSPPPMRGKVTTVFCTCPLARITPAHAGKSVARALVALRGEDHPRPCGEKVVCVCAHLLLPGSPPPMRGKAPDEPTVYGGFRITPAHAGKSFHIFNKASVFQDHPRPCGEKEVTRVTACSGQGSPPPMRGKGPRRDL